MSDDAPRAPRPKHWDTTPTTRERSGKQERRVSKRLGAKTTPNSGATPHAKGDAVNRDYRIEMKTTASKKCPLDADVLETIWHQATATGHTPLIVVTMESIRHPVARDWVLVELDVFEQLSGYTHTKDK